MATSTQTNIASLTSLIADLVAFAVANAGFTDEGTDSSGTETLYRISKTVDGQLMYWWFQENYDSSGSSNRYGYSRVKFGMKLILPTDSNSLSNISSQSFPSIMSAFDYIGPFTKYVFNTEGTCIFMVLECSSGIYTHLSFGNLTKCGTFAGGAYTTGCNPYKFTAQWASLSGGSTNADTPNLFGARSNNSAGKSSDNGCGYVHFSKGFNDRRDFAAFNAEAGSGYSGSRGVTGTMSPSQSDRGYDASYSFAANSSFFINPNGRMIYYAPVAPSTFRTPIFPIQIYRQSDDDSRNCQLLGSIPNIGNVRLNNLNPEEIVNTDWAVYPFSQKNGDNVSASTSGTWGVAYRVVP